MKEQISSILVTGGAGYIGSILVPELLRAGYEVTVIDNFLYNQASLLDVCNFKTLTVVRGDARSENLIKKHILGKDFIIPLACLVGAPLCDKDPVNARTTNLEAVELLLKLRKPGQKIIFPNTNSGYGMGNLRWKRKRGFSMRGMQLHCALPLSAALARVCA